VRTFGIFKVLSLKIEPVLKAAEDKTVYTLNMDLFSLKK
jgi:hypothetical protein